MEYLTSRTTAFVFLFLQNDIQLKHHHILLLLPSSWWVELKWNNRIRLKPFYDTTTFMDYYSKFRLWEGRMRTKRIEVHKIIDLKLEQLDNWNETGWTLNELSFTVGKIIVPCNFQFTFICWKRIIYYRKQRVQLVCNMPQTNTFVSIGRKQLVTNYKAIYFLLFILKKGKFVISLACTFNSTEIFPECVTY